MDKGTEFRTEGGCAEREPYALRVQGDSMAPEFWDGCIIIIEPGAHARDGSYCIADHAGETIFRQLVIEDGRRLLKAVNPAYETIEIGATSSIRGVVIQRAGTRRVHRKHYD